jgi:hypothetical protein
MSIVLIGILIIIILLLLILIYLLTTNKNEKINDVKNNINSIIKLKDLSFPKNIEQMDRIAVRQASKVIVDSYKALDYANKLSNVLDRMEWHTWQVSILLYFLKTQNGLSVNDNIFPQTILDLSLNNKEQEIQKIFKKYMENVNIQKDRDTLSNEIIWNAKEVSIILFKILNH